MTKQSSRGRPKNQSKKVPKLFHLDENLVGQIRQYCFDNQLTQSEFIEMAARRLFKAEQHYEIHKKSIEDWALRGKTNGK